MDFFDIDLEQNPSFKILMEYLENQEFEVVKFKKNDYIYEQGQTINCV